MCVTSWVFKLGFTLWGCVNAPAAGKSNKDIDIKILQIKQMSEGLCSAYMSL